jgi:hypothetical protein
MNAGSPQGLLLQAFRSRGILAMAAAALLGLLALALIVGGLAGHPPLYDELLHILAARGLNQTGEPSIADGLYTRAALFTSLVAASMGAFGDTLVVARLPSLAGAALLLVIVPAWMARRAGFAAGAVTALVLCLIPETLQLAVFVRFYTLHAAVVAGIVILAFEATTPGQGKGRRVACSLGALLLLPLGWHLQPSTAIAAAAALAAVVAVVALDHRTVVEPFLRRHWLACSAALVVLAAAGLFVAGRLGLLAMLREVPVWAAWAADKKLYYVQRLAGDLPLLWPLFPFAGLFAWRARPRLATFCLVVFGVGLLVHSIAAAKQLRYLYYLLPFAAAVAGLAVQSLFDSARSLRQGLLVLVGLGVALAMSAEGQRFARLAAGRMPQVEALPYLVEADWTPVEPALLREAAGADRIVTSNAMKAQYHLGRYDYELNASIVPETESGREFGRDPRTGRPAISTVASLDQLLGQPGATLVILEQESMGLPTHVPAEVVARLESRCAPTTTGTTVGLRVWRCQPVR